MKELLQAYPLTVLETILLCAVALGIFLFFRACWRNIQHN